MCPNPRKPVKESYAVIASRFTGKGMSLEDKFDMIDKALKTGAVTSMQAVELMGVALNSQKDGAKRSLLRLCRVMLIA